MSDFSRPVSDTSFQALVADNIRRYGEFPVPAIVRGGFLAAGGCSGVGARGWVLGGGWVLGSGWGGDHASMTPPPPGLVLRRKFWGWCEGQNVMFSVAWREH